MYRVYGVAAKSIDLAKFMGSNTLQKNKTKKLIKGNNNIANCILIYIQQDATLHSLFFLETALHVLGSTTTQQQERKQLYLQQLIYVTPLLLPAADKCDKYQML